MTQLIDKLCAEIHQGVDAGVDTATLHRQQLFKAATRERERERERGEGEEREREREKITDSRQRIISAFS